MPTPQTPLGRSAAQDVLDWADVEPEARTGAKDVLGLRPEDRAALGMSGAHALDIAPATAGDAHAALLEALARGGTAAKSEKKRR